MSYDTETALIDALYALYEQPLYFAAYNILHDTYMAEDAVVDGKLEANADSSEMIYRESLGNGQWRVAYLIDEADASGNLVLGSSVSRVYVKIS